MAESTAEPVSTATTRRQPAWVKPFLVVFLLVFAAGLIGGGIYGLAHGLHEKSLLQAVPGWSATVGTVADVNTDCYRSCTYSAVVQFQDSSGSVHRFSAPPSSSAPSFGSIVKVSYNPKNPNQAHDLSVNGSNWNVEIGTMIFLISVGSLTLTVFSIACLRLRGRRRGNPDPDSVEPTPTARSRVVIGQAWGMWTGALMIGTLAGAIGVTHNSTWVVWPAVAGVVASGSVLRAVHGRQNQSAENDGELPIQWWRRRGLLLMLLSTVPVYVAIGGAAVAINHH